MERQGAGMQKVPNRPCAKQGCREYAVKGSSYCERHRAQNKTEYNERYDSTRRRPEKGSNYGRRWKETRDAYISAHPYCERCYAEGRLVQATEVHHIKPVSEGGTNAYSNLRSLCHSCHEKTHTEMEKPG